MARIVCDGRSIEAADDRPLLDTLLEAGLTVGHSCRAGLCQSCLVKATRGTPPAESQAGLRPTLAAQGFFLACVARPVEGIEIATDAAAGVTIAATIASVLPLADDVVQVVLRPHQPFEYRAGQYLSLVREDGLARSYSIASPPGSDVLELHVRVLSQGRMSGWLASAPEGTTVGIRGPAGECFYQPGNPDQPLVLAGTGTGLAPLWGVLRDALSHGHRGTISLLHGARSPRGLYFVDRLRALADEHDNVCYSACVLEDGDERTATGDLEQVLLARTASFAGHRVFLCGDPGLVQRLKRRVFLAGGRLNAIHADPFIVAAPAT